MLEKNVNSLELRIRIIEGEIRENKREKEKYLGEVIGLIATFVIFLGIDSYIFFLKEEKITRDETTLAIIFSVIIFLFCLFFGPYLYSKYQKVKKQIEKLEQELKRLKEELKE